jgi:NAD(P)-dependent dehydrogenase (short-subunit alcohol dehydrogenase family)
MKRILLTGGTSGLGEAIALKLSENHKVWFTYYKSIDKANILENKSSNLKAIKCDFTNSESIHELTEFISGSDLDILINNAMTGFEKNHFHKLSPDYFKISFEENILSAIKITSAVIKVFRRKKSGKIITILSSVLNEHPPIGWSEYLAQKSYLKSLTRSWAAENVRYGIVSNTVSPSFMLTGLHSKVDEREIQLMEERHPLGKLLEPAKVAEAVLFFVQATEYINGVDMVINSAENVF